MSDVAAELIVEIKGKTTSIDSLLQKLEGELRAADAGAQKTADTISGKLSAAEAQAAREAQQLYQAQVRLRVAQGDLSGAIGLVETHLKGLEQGSLAAVRAETQLAQLQTKLASESRGLGDFLNGAGQSALGFAGGLGIATTATGALLSVIGRVKEGFDLRATLDEQRRTLGALFGDVERGNKVFAEGADFGKRFGFTQKEMGQSVQEAALLIKNSTAPASKLLEVLARLSALNPEQGISGAALALKELQAGQVVSIVNRFNLSRDAANQMKAAITSGKDAVLVLDQQLAKMGVTADILAQRTQGAAGAVRTYAQAQENLSLAMGRFAEGPGKQVIQTLADITSRMTTALSAGEGGAKIGQQIVTQAQSYEQYRKSIADASEAIKQIQPQIGELTEFFARNVQGIQPLSQAQFNYAQSLIQTGTAADAAVVKAKSLNDTFVQIGVVQERVGQSGEIGAQALDRLSNSMLQTAASGPAGAAAVESLATAFIAGGLTAQQFQQALDNLASEHQFVAQAAASAAAAEAQRAEEHRGGAEATQVNSQAVQENIQALAAHLQSTQQSTQQTQLFSAAQNTLAQLGAVVANGLLTDGQAALQLASQYGVAYAEALKLIQAQATIAKEKVRVQAVEDFRAGERSGGQFSTAKAQADAANAARAAAQRQREEAERLTQAEARYNREIGNFAPLKARAREEAALAKQRGDQAGYLDALTNLHNLDQAEEAAAKKGQSRAKKAGAVKLSDQQKLNNSVLANQEKADGQLEDLATKHELKLLEIEREAAEKSLAQQRRNEVSKRQSRADFYDQLSQDSPVIGDEVAGQLSAAYEDAYAKARAIEQSGNAQLAADYAELRSRQIQKDEEYYRRLGELKKTVDDAKAENKSDEEIAKAQRAYDLEKQRLDRIKQLRDDANREEEQQLLAGGDAIQNERTKKIEEENRAYEEQTGKITNQADRAAQAKILAAQRAGKAVDAENLKLEQQAGLYERINRAATTRGGAPATSAAAASTASTPAAAAATATPASASGVTPVLDAGVLAAIAALGEMLEQKIGEMVTAERTGADKIAGAMQSKAFG